jgi:hypothetical protein
MDGWANPLVASALLSSRDGIMDRDKHKSFVKGNGAPPALNGAKELIRWDPWVRVNLGVTEMTGRVAYKPNGSDSFVAVLREGNKDLVELKRPDLPFFVAQLKHVQSWAELRDERALEVLAQIDNQYAFIAAVTGLNVSRMPWTIEWLTIGIQFTVAVEMVFKHALGCFRPVHLSPQVQPIITTPGHGTYPMGHAAQAFVTIVALRGLLGLAETHETYQQLYRQARRISVNRTVAGTHFPIDAAAGQVLGLSLGELFVRASGLSKPDCFDRKFVPAGSGDATVNDYLGDGTVGPAEGCTTGTTALTVTPSDFLKELVRLAKPEWSLT